MLRYGEITAEAQRAQRLSNNYQRTQNEVERTPGYNALHLIYISTAMAALHHHQLNTTPPTYIRRISTQAFIPTSHPKPAERIEKPLPAPHTTRAGGAYQEGAQLW